MISLRAPQACRVQLKATIAKPHAAALTEAAIREARMDVVPLTPEAVGRGKRLEAILLLHLHHGRDYYVSVSALWAPSIFGLELSARMTVGQPLLEWVPPPLPAMDDDVHVAAAAVAAPTWKDRQMRRLAGILSERESSREGGGQGGGSDGVDGGPPSPTSTETATKSQPTSADTLTSTEPSASGGGDVSTPENGGKSLVPFELHAMLGLLEVAIDHATAATARANEASTCANQAAEAVAAVSGWGGEAAAGSEAATAKAAEAAAAAAAAAEEAHEASEALFYAFPDEAFTTTSTSSAHLSVKAAERHEEAAELVRALESGAPLPRVSLPALGFTLLRWASALSDAVVPAALLGAAEAAAPNRAASVAIIKCLPSDHAAVFVPTLLLLRRMLRAQAAASKAADVARRAAGSRPADASPAGAWAKPMKPLPAEYLPPTTEEDAAPAPGDVTHWAPRRTSLGTPTKKSSEEKPPPRIALSSRLCTLVGEAFLTRGGWWPAVFLRHFLDELDHDEATLEWATANGGSADGAAESPDAPPGGMTAKAESLAAAWDTNVYLS